MNKLVLKVRKDRKMSRDELKKKIEVMVEKLKYNLKKEQWIIEKVLMRTRGICGTCHGEGKPPTLCCCEACGDYRGHFQVNDGLNKGERIEIEKIYGFDGGKGFMGEKGCKLPQILRSTICRIHICKTGKEMYSKVELLMFEYICLQMREKRAKILKKLRNCHKTKPKYKS